MSINVAAAGAPLRQSTDTDFTDYLEKEIVRSIRSVTFAVQAYTTEFRGTASGCEIEESQQVVIEDCFLIILV